MDPSVGIVQVCSSIVAPLALSAEILAKIENQI